MLTILLCVLIAAYTITLYIAAYNEWRVYREIPLGKTLIRVSLLVLATISLPLVSNIDEELEKNSAEISRVTVTDTETNETLFSAEGNLSVHTSWNNTSTLKCPQKVRQYSEVKIVQAAERACCL